MGLEAQLIEQRKERLARLTANGRRSSELDVLSPPVFRRVNMARKDRQRALAIDAKWKEAIERARLIPFPPLQLPPPNPVDSVDPPVIEWQPRVRDVFRMVSEASGIPLIALVAYNRNPRTSHYRHIGYYLARTLTTKSLPHIARLIMRRDHTTILHGVQRITRLIRDNAEVAEEVAAIRRKIMGPE